MELCAECSTVYQSKHPRCRLAAQGDFSCNGLSGLRSLHSLCLINCPNLNVVGIGCLTAVKGLRELVIGRCPRVTVGAVKGLQARLPALRYRMDT